MADTFAIFVAAVRKRYGAVVALDGIDVAAPAGTAVGLLGPNGAGKSTLVKILCGLVLASGGRAEVAGHAAGSREARAAIGYLAELFRFPPWLTVREVLGLHQRLAGSVGGAAEVGRLLERVELGYAADRRVAELSKGMQQRLGIAQALVGHPRVVILDEPTSALDPGGRRMVRELIADLRDDGVAVLVSSHLLAEVEQTCDEVVVLAGGRVAAAGTVEALAGREQVVITTDAGTATHDLSEAAIPDLVAALVGEGRRVYEVRRQSNRLEEAYLEVVRQAEEQTP